jgi:hypothetical protein
MKSKQTIIRDVTGLAGAALVSVGAGMVYRPAGVILGGIILVLLAMFGFTADTK